jgi:hypothetical protein
MYDSWFVSVGLCLGQMFGGIGKVGERAADIGNGMRAVQSFT